MTSKSQRERGWTLPEVLTGHDLLCVQLKIPNNPEYRAAFGGAIQELAYWFNWKKSYEPGDTRAAQAAYYWRELIDTYLCVENDPGSLGMGCGCGCKEPTNQRYTEDGFLEQSFDGGETWERATDDPRFNAPIFPPIPGDDGTDKKCDAAASAAKVIDDDIVQKMEEGMTFSSILAIFAAVIALLLSGGAAAPLLVGLIGQIITFGINATKAAFTTTTWELFECILFCNMNDDGSFTEEQWLQIKADITTIIGTGIEAVFLKNTVNAFGVSGITNAARSQRVTGADCSSCGCIDECAAASQTPYFTFGTVLSVTGDTVRVRSELFTPVSGSPFWNVSWGTYGVVGTKCCQWQEVNVVSGGSWSSSQTEYTDCGGTIHANLDPTHVNITHVALYPTGQVIFDIKFPS